MNFIDMPPSRDAPPVPATRLACDRCHDHKLRCDRSPVTGEPCRRCARVKAECRYGRPRRFGRPRKRKDSVMEESVGSSPGALAPAHGSTAPPSKLIHRDSGVAGTDSPAFYEVGDTSLGRDPTSVLPGTELPNSTEMLLSEGALYAEPLAPSVVDDTDWLGANMTANDIDMSLFTNFDADDFMFTEDGRLPTPPDSPDCDSDNTAAGSCFSASDIFAQPTAPGLSRQEPIPPGDGGQDGDIIDALTQLQLRLHQISTLPKEPLPDQSNGRCTLIEETIKASQTFNEILRRMCQSSPPSPPSPTSPGLTTSKWSPSEANSPVSCFASHQPSSFAINASTSLLTLVCYVLIIKSCKDVLLLLRRVLSPDVGACNTNAIPALDSISASLPQIKIGSIRTSSPRIQVALLAQLLASILDEVRGCIGQLVASAGGTDQRRTGAGGCKTEAYVGSGPSAAADRTDGRPAADLMRLADEGVWRDEAGLKRQLLAMTQLLQ